MGDFPQIEDTSKKPLKINQDKVKTQLGRLHDDLQVYTKDHGGSGTPSDVQGILTQEIRGSDIGATGNGGQASSSFPAGEAVYSTLKQIDGANGFGTAYSAFVKAYGEVISQLYKNAGVVDTADQASTATKPTTTSTTSFNS